MENPPTPRRDEETSDPPANILLVDDRPENLLALEAILADLGLGLVRAGSGTEVLARLHDRDFAAILLDVRMPGMDGFETARLIRDRDGPRHTPILFITAFADDPNFPAADAYALGAVDYLVKPLVPVILRAKVMGFVELFRKTAQIERQAEQLRAEERRRWEAEREKEAAIAQREKAEEMARRGREFRVARLGIEDERRRIESSGAGTSACGDLEGSFA
jgi:CheY-like chemotaxis protein